MLFGPFFGQAYFGGAYFGIPSGSPPVILGDYPKVSGHWYHWVPGLSMIELGGWLREGEIFGEVHVFKTDHLIEAYDDEGVPENPIYTEPSDSDSELYTDEPAPQVPVYTEQ